MSAASCAKKPQSLSGTSLIALQVPSLSKSGSGGQTKSEIGTFAAIPTTRKACFGVNIVAADIKGLPSETCNPKTGIVAGFVESGGLINVEVPKGEGRTFELYLYLASDGDTSPCPQMGMRFSSAQLSKLYYLGAATGISIKNAVEDVTITATFPGVAQTLAVANSYPTSCTVTSNPSSVPGFSVSAEAGVATGAGMKLNGRFGRNDGTVLSGGGMKLIAK